MGLNLKTSVAWKGRRDVILRTGIKSPKAYLGFEEGLS